LQSKPSQSIRRPTARSSESQKIRVFPSGQVSEGDTHYTKNICIASASRPVTLYSLDVIISVGYRVKSHRGTQFRIWATRTLKERLVQSYRERRRIEGRGIADVRDALSLAQSALASSELGGKEAKAILAVIERYARSWSLLLQYDVRLVLGLLDDVGPAT
jgi:hypothetical protein